MTLITAIKDQLCNLCNKNLCFIKLKQLLNCKVHNLGKTASRFLFWQVLIYEDLLYLSVLSVKSSILLDVPRKRILLKTRSCGPHFSILRGLNTNS